MAKDRVYFDVDIVRIQERKVSYKFYGINVYKCRPFVSHHANELYPERGFDLYLHCKSFAGKRMPNGKCERKKLEIAVCFSWIDVKKYKKVKQYSISGIEPFIAKALVHLCIRRFLIGKLGYEVENWKVEFKR